MLIYTPKLTSRVKYIFDFIFGSVLKLDVAYTTDELAFEQSDRPKIVYAAENTFKNIPYFKSSPFMMQNRIQDIDLTTTRFTDVNVPFPIKDSTFNFDIFAASFYIVSRYEEYLFNKNQQKTFTVTESFQYKNGLRRPLVDEWALLLKNMLLKHYPALKFGAKNFINIPTINLVAESAEPTGFMKKSEALFKSILHKDGRRDLFDALTGLSVNLDNNLDFLNTFFKKLNIVPFYFIGFENEAAAETAFELFISKIKLAINIGLLSPCPDIENQKAISSLINSFNALPLSNELVTQQQGNFSMPGCYLQLLKNGVYTDFSMGYQEVCGFRAGTCTPYYWYDLQLEKQSDLKIYPYAVSDSALQNRLVSEAEDTYKAIIDRVKLVDGTFSSTWSLKSLSENVKFKKWRAQYQSMIAYAGNGNQLKTI